MIWDKILKWLFHPITIICAILLFSLSTTAYLLHDSQVNKLEAKISGQEKLIEAQDRNITILQQDKPLIDQLLKSKQTIIIKEQKLQSDLDAIPDTSTNLPFTNPDLLAAAQRLREYQTSQD